MRHGSRHERWRGADTGRRWTGVGAHAMMALGVIVLGLSVSARAGEADGGGKASVPLATNVNIGTEGVVEYRVAKEDGRVPRLRGARVDRLSGALVWMDGMREEADAGVYTVRFVANIPGEFDLAGLMERVDGGSTASLPALPVSVWGFLPEDHDGRLIELSAASASPMGGYRVWMAVLAGVWLTPLVVVLARRMLRRRETPAVVVEPKPSLADQLAPLVEAAINGTADSATQSRLELLLLSYWRERARLRELPMREALARLRAEPEAGKLLGAVERWLHAPPGGTVGSLSGEIGGRAERLSAARTEAVELLAPYRHAPAFRSDEVESGDARGAGGQTRARIAERGGEGAAA